MMHGLYSHWLKNVVLKSRWAIGPNQCKIPLSFNDKDVIDNISFMEVGGGAFLAEICIMRYVR